MNAVNPLLEPDHIAHILTPSKTQGSGHARADARGGALGEGRRASAAAAEPAQRARRRRGATRSREDVLPFDRRLRRQPARSPRERPPHRGGRRRRVLPHRRHDRTAEARAPHAPQPGLQAWAVALMLGTGSRARRCSAACRCSTSAARRHRADAVVAGGTSCPDAAGLPHRDACATSGARRALPARRSRRRADGLAAAARRAARRRRHLELPAVRVSAAARRCRRADRALRGATGVPVLEVYGMTESVERAHRSAYRDGRRAPSARSASACPTAAGARRRSTARARYARDCAVDEIGVSRCTGPSVRRLPERRAQPEACRSRRGWLNTGDLGRLDADGYFWLTGRAKDLIIRGGHNIDPIADRGSDDASTRRCSWPRRSASPMPMPANCRRVRQLRPAARRRPKRSCSRFAQGHDSRARRGADRSARSSTRSRSPPSARSSSPQLRFDAARRACSMPRCSGVGDGAVHLRRDRSAPIPVHGTLATVIAPRRREPVRACSTPRCASRSARSHQHPIRDHMEGALSP